MSSPRNCKVIELNPGEWFCVVAGFEGDEHFRTGRTFGPAPTAAEAFDKMLETESNPGGFVTVPHDKVDEDDLLLVARFVPAPPALNPLPAPDYSKWY